VLAGGTGRRLGNLDKPELVVGDRRLLDIALAAVTPARTVVVGPARSLPIGVLSAREHPPLGGPAAALVAGLAALSSGCELVETPRADDLVAVLAADLPGIDDAWVSSLVRAVKESQSSGAVLIDPDGRSQYLAGVWRWGSLAASAAGRQSWTGARVHDLLGHLIGVRVAADHRTVADVDIPADLPKWGISGTRHATGHD